MSCFHPLKAWPVGVSSETGKTQYKVTAYNCIDVDSKIGEPVEIPCGKCVGCRMRYSRTWADRCLLESKYHAFNYFVTLTYDDEHVPTSSYFDDFDNVVPVLTLVKKDLQLYFKRLRKKGFVFRYYACGEYGDSTFRPHYHVLFFADTAIPDLKAFTFKRGDWFYTSEFLESEWSLGHVLVGDLTWASAAYTARYVMKKLGGYAAEDYRSFGLEPEFCVMSRKPGIGYQYFEDHKDEIYKNGVIHISTYDGGKKMLPSAYFDRLMELDNPELMRDIKQQRRSIAENTRVLKQSQTDLDWLSYLDVEEQSLFDKSKQLIRSEM